ncbi:MAG: IS66 family transposase, partial [Pirellulales bacterium]
MLRQQEATPIFGKLREWIAELKVHLLPNSKIGRSAGCFHRHADGLGRDLGGGRREVDNNRCERAIRQIAVGRKTWLFAGSEVGGQSAATLYSLTVGCWELGLDPLAYLTDVLERLSSTPSSR